jgi:hypothetical protein
MALRAAGGVADPPAGTGAPHAGPPFPFTGRIVVVTCGLRMALYELSIEPALVRQGEQIVSLQGRGYPTVVMHWESRLFEQPWTTTLVLDYCIALPPLIAGQGNFNEVRLAAFVGGAPTKFLYFGTEMSENVPRIGPEMENVVAPARAFQEFRLDEVSCPVPYLKLIQTTPKIYGNGPQDYYSPPLKVERYDGVAGSEHLADFFPFVVANLDPVAGSVLTDPGRGFWTGARFLGPTKIAILREKKVVGLHQRVGRPEKDPPPPDLKPRNPKLDVLRAWVAIDFGAASTVVAVRGAQSPTPELVRIGGAGAPIVPADYESPTEVAFESLSRAAKAWRDRVILPATRWEDVVVGHEARARRSKPGPEQAARAAATLTELPWLRERIERKEALRLRGLRDPDTNEALKKPAPPIIDEDGIGAHDPFDPIELYAYYVGLHLNHRSRGLYLRYSLTMPTGWPSERRQSVLVAFRRGLFRSLPAGLVEYHDLEGLQVVDGGPAAVPFAVHAFRAFAVQPKDGPVPFCAIDAGASETGIVCGLYRQARNEEREDGFDRMVEYLEPAGVPWLGGERLLRRLAWRAYQANGDLMRAARVPIERPADEPAPDEAPELCALTPEARGNTTLLKDALRPILTGDVAARLPAKLALADENGASRELALELDRAALTATLQGWLAEAVTMIEQAISRSLVKIGRGPDPYEGLHVFLGGRLGMHPVLADRLTKALPPQVKIHRFQEPGKGNMAAPTVKTSTALGALAMKLDRIGARRRAEDRDAFRYRVGRGRHGQLLDALDPTVDYDAWREMGACSKPDVEVLFMEAADDPEVAADDPRVMRALCRLGADAVGHRLYVRAVGPARIEVTVGPPGGEPGEGAPRWAVDLVAAVAEPAF